MILLTAHAVRRKGTGTALTECVMCLVDGDQTPATHMVDLGDHEAAYCEKCALTMKNNGFPIGLITNPDPPINLKKITQAQTMLRQKYAVMTVAQRTGLTRDEVAKIAERLGLARGTRIRRASSDVGRPPEVDREKIETLIEEGTSVRSTAELAKVSTNTVQRVKREMKSPFAIALELAQKELAEIQPQIDQLLKRSRSLESVIQALESM